MKYTRNCLTCGKLFVTNNIKFFFCRKKCVKLFRKVDVQRSTSRFSVSGKSKKWWKRELTRRENAIKRVGTKQKLKVALELEKKKGYARFYCIICKMKTWTFHEHGGLNTSSTKRFIVGDEDKAIEL